MSGPERSGGAANHEHSAEFVRPERSGGRMSERIRVATVITRMAAGAGGVALRGALALDPERYHITVITGATGVTGEPAGGRGEVLTGADAVKDARAGDLLAEAFTAGLDVVRVAATSRRTLSSTRM